MNEMVDAYAAGFVDADGCIGIKFRYGGSGFGAYTVVVQKEPKIPYLLEAKYGGSVGIVWRGDKSYFRWTVHGETCLTFLRKVEPYIIDKYYQLKIAIECLEHMVDIKKIRYQTGKYGTQPTLTEPEIRWRECRWLKMKSLNTCHKLRAAAETKPSDSNADAIVRSV